MKEEMAELIRYRIARAREALDEAGLMFREGHNIATVNRLYYACFYAISALLLTDALSSSKHRGIQSLFNQHYIKTGYLPLSLGVIYNTLFEWRHKGDYDDFIELDITNIKKWLEEALILVNTISQLTEDKISKAKET